MKRILMVCLGNICRSPMAEGILKHQLEVEGIKAIVDSAGTSAYHQGEPPDQRAMEECLKHGIDISDQRSRPFTPSDFDSFDLILAMDGQNYRNIHSMVKSSNSMDHVRMMMDFVHPSASVDVPDPWYGS